MNIFEFILILLFLLITPTLAFFVGFGIGDHGKNTDAIIIPRKIRKTKKEKPPDTERERYKEEINRILGNIEKYDGKPPVVRGDKT